MPGLPKKNASKNKLPESKEQGVIQNHPLFFLNPQVINLEQHGEARLRTDLNLKFAAATNAIPLVVTEMAEAAKYYPIAFTAQAPAMPVAIVGLEKDNYFVSQDGKWREDYYIPAYVRKYPFVFMESPGGEQLTLCVDEAAISSDGKGAKLYEDKKASAHTSKALEFCKAYQEQHQLTRRFCDTLKRLELLIPQRSDIKLANGRTMQLAGFQSIDIAKFKAIDGQEVLAMHKDDSLALIYYCIQSQSNWQSLLNLANKKDSKNGKTTF